MGQSGGAQRAPKFARWIRDRGVSVIAEELGLTAPAVHHWLRWAEGGAGTCPTPQRAYQIMKISRALTWEDIYPKEKVHK